MAQAPAPRKPSFVLLFAGVLVVVLAGLGAVSKWNSGATERNRNAFKAACITAVENRLGQVSFTGDYEPNGDIDAWQWPGTAISDQKRKVLCVQHQKPPTLELLVWGADGKLMK